MVDVPNSNIPADHNVEETEKLYVYRIFQAITKHRHETFNDTGNDLPIIEPTGSKWNRTYVILHKYM